MALGGLQHQAFSKFAFSLDAFSQVTSRTGGSDISDPICAASTNRNAMFRVNNTGQWFATQVTTMTEKRQLSLPLFQSVRTRRLLDTSLAVATMRLVTLCISRVVSLLRLSQFRFIRDVIFTPFQYPFQSGGLVQFALVLLIAISVLNPPFFTVAVMPFLIAFRCVPLTTIRTHPLSIRGIKLTAVTQCSFRFAIGSVAGFAMTLKTIGIFCASKELPTIQKTRTPITPFFLRVLDCIGRSVKQLLIFSPHQDFFKWSRGLAAAAILNPFVTVATRTASQKLTLAALTETRQRLCDFTLFASLFDLLIIPQTSVKQEVLA